MSFSRSVPLRSIAALAVVAVVLAPSPATAHGSIDHEDGSTDTGGAPLFLNHDESLFEHIAAPFACGTEWSGGTRPGHGQNDWNLDFNRTSLDYGENRQHDLGQPLFAQGDGVVTYIGWQVNAGTYLDIDYGDYGARYIHLVDDSVVPPLGATVEQGELIALLGDTGNTPGFAHLHLEYWDSRGFEAAQIWELKQAGQPQTEVTFDGNVIDPGEVVVSTNCVGAALEAGTAPPPEPDPPTDLTAFAARLTEPAEPGASDTFVFNAFNAVAHSSEGTTENYWHATAGGDHLVAQIEGTDLAAETILITASYASARPCNGIETTPCTGIARNAAPVAVAIGLVQDLAAAPARRTVVFALFEDHDESGTAAADWAAGPGADVIDDVVGVIDLGSLGESVTWRQRAHSLVTATSTWSDLPVHALDDPVGPRWQQLGNEILLRPLAATFVDLGLPVAAFGDLPGGCSAGDSVSHTVLAPGKLDHQFADIAAIVEAVANADAPPTPGAVPDLDTLSADATALALLLTDAGLTPPPEVVAMATGATPPDADALAALTAAADAARSELADLDCTPFGVPAPFDDIDEGSFALADIGLLTDRRITNGTSATTYGPNDPVTREQMAAFLGRIWRLFHPGFEPTAEMPFGDVADTSYAYDDIRILVEFGITTGETPTRYGPDGLVSREQMAAFLARLWRALHPAYDESMVEPHPFVDVDPTSFAAADIALIFHLGITTGTSPTTYAPDDPVTREQMAAFLARLIRGATPDVLDDEGGPDPEVE